MKTDALPDSYGICVRGFCANLLVAVLVGLMASIFPLLLNRDAAIFYASMPVYFSVVFLFVCVKLIGRWSLVSAILMFSLCGWLRELPNNIFYSNTFANLVQIGFFVWAVWTLRRFEQKNINMYYKEKKFFLSFYNLCLLGIFVAYIAFCVVSDQPKECSFGDYCFGAVVVLTIAKSIHNKDPFLICYSLGISFFPSLVCSAISAYGGAVPPETWPEYVKQWTMSNYILLQTIGYIAYQVLYHKKFALYRNGENKVFSFSTILFYAALLGLNIAILYIIKQHLFSENQYVCFFPWLFGNVFLCLNLYFSLYVDADSQGEDNRFAWYENRVKVVEKNMGFIITIISFLLPLGFTHMREIPSRAVVVFVANIFCACITLGLVWIPTRHIKFINLLKCVKTIFYLYSITLLLICSTMIVVQIAKMKQSNNIREAAPTTAFTQLMQREAF